jgi:hypothetical protein
MEGTTATEQVFHNAIHDVTAPAINRRIEQEMRDRITLYAHKSPEEISQRISELEQEWDIDRCLESNGSALALAGMVLSWVGGRKWLLLPALTLPMLFMHAVQGACPAVPLLRRFGIRSRREIDSEIYALRLLRGDFDGSTGPERALKALEPELRPVE